ncbi:MAG: hypothetical protein HYY17_13275 [Planctomycetes bacterium]|nr:hypothetical protein [Planctomycetota bacterium]
MALLFEPGSLHITDRKIAVTQDAKTLASALCRILDVARLLTRNDIKILRAVAETDSIAAAARLLAPDKPSYRSYLQKRWKKIVRIRDRILCEITPKNEVDTSARTDPSPNANDLHSPR